MYVCMYVCMYVYVYIASLLNFYDSFISYEMHEWHYVLKYMFKYDIEIYLMDDINYDFLWK